MPTSSTPAITLRVEPSLTRVDAAGWDRCASAPASEAMRVEAAPAAAQNDVESISQDADSISGEDPGNPLISHAFLLSLEESGSAVPRTGWAGAHLVAHDETGQMLGCAPCYLKSHSRGEYVFDQGWADAYERAGGTYYPKLQVSVPFTPATGRRMLIAPDAPAETVRTALVEGLRALRRQANASSIHATFLSRAEWDHLGAQGFLQRTDQQFHWLNQGFDSFGAFLETFASRKRKVVNRERRDALANGITVEHVTGSDITEAHWDAFFTFYMDTGSRKWGRPYLTRTFFSLIGERLADRILLVMAKRAGRYIAGAINFIGDTTLYGRNWGCVEHHPFLHFEVCYYQAIDFAIARKLARVEAGAQGEHKLARGYRPVTTYSAHDLADPALKRAVADYLAKERRYVAELHSELTEQAPYKRR